MNHKWKFQSTHSAGRLKSEIKVLARSLLSIPRKILPCLFLSSGGGQQFLESLVSADNSTLFTWLFLL